MMKINQNRVNSHKSKPIVGTSKASGNKVYYNGVNEAGRAGFDACSINKCIRKGGTHKGYSWAYQVIETQNQ